MGILELHFHDSQLTWNVGGGETGEGRSFSLGTGAKSGNPSGGRSRSRGGTDGPPSMAPKLKSIGALALLVGGAMAYNRLKARRAQKRAEAESGSLRRRLSPRSK
ncbi:MULTISPECIES: hypothetical protein [Halorussus]|uniref:hypothetical protein n=1 Tax=Halorussus TaxID=1070314 RepID=UPI00209F8AF6|nr:hypothetical protein [Halorussus vallis]USZ76791.1 hypothetical protein NGM07_05555 [Halorussus vallis]